MVLRAFASLAAGLISSTSLIPCMRLLQLAFKSLSIQVLSIANALSSSWWKLSWEKVFISFPVKPRHRAKIFHLGAISWIVLTVFCSLPSWYVMQTSSLLLRSSPKWQELLMHIMYIRDRDKNLPKIGSLKLSSVFCLRWPEDLKAFQFKNYITCCEYTCTYYKYITQSCIWLLSELWSMWVTVCWGPERLSLR